MHNCGTWRLHGTTCAAPPSLPRKPNCKLYIISASTAAPSAEAATGFTNRASDVGNSTPVDVETCSLPVAKPIPDEGVQVSNITQVSATSRRRRRSSAAKAEGPTAAGPHVAPAQPAKKKSQKRNAAPLQQNLQQLFQSPSTPPGIRVRRVSAKQQAVIPEGAEADARKVAAATATAAAVSKARSQAKQLDPKLLAAFQPYKQLFPVAADTVTAGRPSAGDDHMQHSKTPSSSSRADATADAETQQVSDVQQQQQSLPWSDQGQGSRDLTQLFTPASSPHSFKVVRLRKDTPVEPLPETARYATRQLAALIASQQQRRQKQQQQQTAATDPAGADAASTSAVADAEQSVAKHSLEGATGALQQGITRVYAPAPPKGAPGSAKQRKPLQLVTARQQQHMREEARRMALQQLQERNLQEYEAALQAMLSWQPSTQQRYYLADIPPHLPVAVQRQWKNFSNSNRASSTANSTSNSTSSDLSISPEAGAGQGVIGSDAVDTPPSTDPASATPVLTDEQQQVLQGINKQLRRQLGCDLPARALRGERSLLLASLSPQAVKERLDQWVGCCGREYVLQLMTKEPTLLAHEPWELLTTLEAINSEMQLPPQACVALMLKQPALIGLDTDELRVRLAALSEAVGCDKPDAARLVAAAAELVMMHPDYVKERMSALARLLPEASSKLARHVVRHPYIIKKSPRAVARNVLQMSNALELSAWATCRLVSGMPSLLNTNYDMIRNRLDRLQQLAGNVRRWNRELQALTPASLARCLIAPDATIDRLQQLLDMGAANYKLLPAINKILTQPAQWWEVTLAKVAAAKEKYEASRDAAGSAAPVADGTRAGQPSDVQQTGEEVVAPSSVQLAARAAARAALAKIRHSTVVSKDSSLRGATSSSSLEDDGVMHNVSDGLLGQDESWRSSIATAILDAAASLQAQVPIKGHRSSTKTGRRVLQGKQLRQHDAATASI